jgi:hypothetical protein
VVGVRNVMKLMINFFSVLICLKKCKILHCVRICWCHHAAETVLVTKNLMYARRKEWPLSGDQESLTIVCNIKFLVMADISLKYLSKVQKLQTDISFVFLFVSVCASVEVCRFRNKNKKIEVHQN